MNGKNDTSSSTSNAGIQKSSRGSAASRRFDMDPAEKGREIKAAEARNFIGLLA